MLPYRRASVAAVCVTALLATHNAAASPALIALGSLTSSSAGSYADLSGLSGTLENGQPANLLGGLGSGLAYAGGSTFIAVPDRGPNATPYNSAVDDTTSYIDRFQTLNLGLTATPSGNLPYTLTPTLTSTTLMYSNTALTYGAASGPLPSGVPALNQSNGHYYFTGRSDGFDSAQTSLNAGNARLDPESVRVSNDGKSLFISDEYGPYVYQFDRATGERTRTFSLPANLGVTNLSAHGDTEISGNSIGRVSNKGMEGLALTPDGKTLVGVMQASLEQDKKGSLRIVTVDIATGATHEYAYQLSTGSGVSDIVAINDHQFLVDERDGAGLGGDPVAAGNIPVKQVFEIDLSNAQDVSAITGPKADLSGKAVPKTLVLDVAAELAAKGIPADQIPSKIEGLSFGKDVTINGQTLHTLYVANDNDFVAGTAGPNNFYVFALNDADLHAAYMPQQFASVPLPGALPLFGSALAGLAALRRRRKLAVSA